MANLSRSPHPSGPRAILLLMCADRTRLEAMIATAAMDEAQRSAWCREKGVFPSDLVQWRESAMAALA